jgi:hypothetical protein
MLVLLRNQAILLRNLSIFYRVESVWRINEHISVQSFVKYSSETDRGILLILCISKRPPEGGSAASGQGRQCQCTGRQFWQRSPGCIRKKPQRDCSAASRSRNKISRDPIVDAIKSCCHEQSTTMPEAVQSCLAVLILGLEIGPAVAEQRHGRLVVVLGGSGR